MAKKFTPGIPDNFSFDVKPVADLGDYLDEPTPRPQKVVAKPQPDAAVQSQPVMRPETTRVTVEIPPVVTPARPAAPLVQAVSKPAAYITPAATTLAAGNREERGLRPKAPRREISMTPETLEMSDELLELVRSGSGQRDTKANELFHALVLLAYEAKEELDCHTIPKRGRWGSPTARAYPLELKNAFLQALLKKYADVAESPTGLQYPVNSSA